MEGDETKSTASSAAPAPAETDTPPVAEGGTKLDGLERIAVQDKVIEALRTCYDPEIPVNIYELGLIYEVKVEPSGAVYLQMTLTAPNCPAAGTLPGEVQQKVQAVPGVTSAKVEVVWEPTWDPSKMTEAARLQLGMF